LEYLEYIECSEHIIVISTIIAKIDY